MSNGTAPDPRSRSAREASDSEPPTPGARDTEQGTDRDPTLIRSQPALTTSTGRIWLIVGGLLSLVAVVVLSALLALDPIVATAGVALIVIVYVAMVVVRLTVTEPRRRLVLMAVAMILIAIISLTCVGVIAATEWEPLA